MIKNRSQFQYVPSSGPLPGRAFEAQTKAAINEVSNLSSESKDKADAALKTANSAIGTANNALEIANTAQSTANNAVITAQNAQSTASDALVKSETAIGTANAALDKAANAESSASQGSATAGQANATANAALQKATTAQETADRAENTANTAIAASQSSLYYEQVASTVENPFVINKKRTSAKYFIFDMSLVDLPGTVKEQGFLTVRSEKTDMDTASYYVYQTYHTISGVEYSRTAIITAAESGDDAIVWGPWVQTALVPTKIIFTVDDSRWGMAIDAIYPLTIASDGKIPIGVYRQNGSDYELVQANIVIKGSDIVIGSSDKFTGYLLIF